MGVPLSWQLMRIMVKNSRRRVRRAKTNASKTRVPLRPFVTEALKDELIVTGAKGEKPWMKHVGKLKDLRKETERINRIIDEAFE